VGNRLRLCAAGVVTAAAFMLPATAVAQEFSSCWVTEVSNPLVGRTETITRCRISGSEVVDYSSDGAVPGTLYAQTGTDITGQCWYYTSSPTSYVILVQFADGSAEIGFDPDPGNPGGPIAIGPILPRCSSEPTAASDPTADAWNYVMQYIHPPPTPELSPKAGDGVTGLATYVGLPIPGEHNAQISSGASTLDIYIEVSAVVVDWGDGESDSYPATSTALAGYPDGFASHLYETKDDSAPITVAYDWTARWRIVGGTWDFLAVPNTTTAVDYPVAEIVSDLTG